MAMSSASQTARSRQFETHSRPICRARLPKLLFWKAMAAPAAAGTPINGGAFTVPSALANRRFHAYSDFLLHDIGTGDGIPIEPIPQFAGTASQIRTAPLWGLRTRNRLMHDGLSFTYDDAIQRHDGQAAAARDAFNALGDFQKVQIIDFLNSL